MSAKMTTADAVEKLPHDHCYTTSSKLCRNNTPYLPREIIFNILIFIPAKHLFHTVRYVCKQWYDIISDPDFVRANCQMSTLGFLIQNNEWPHNDNHIIHIDPKTPTLNDVIELQIPFPVVLVSCFNGLVLLLNSSDREILVFHVVNPLTKENISLPPLTGCSPPSICENKTGLAIDSSGHYKVVYASGVYASVMKVFTIGIDKAWRFIDLQFIPVNSDIRKAMFYSPQYFGGFIYWFTRYTNTTGKSYGVAFDIDTETIYQFSQPKDVVKNLGLAMFVSMGTSLGFILEQGFIWRLWKLTDVKSGEWTELAHINVSTLYSRFNEVFDPCVKMRYYPFELFGGQLWLHRDVNDGTHRSFMVRYNFGNEKMVVVPIKINPFHFTPLSYAHTLVSPKNI